MKFHLGLLLAVSFFGGGAMCAAEVKVPAIAFDGTQYLHRWVEGDQHEFTPQGQEDLDRWSEMMTIIRHPNVTDGDSLAATANAVLETYKRNHGMVLRTQSVPRTDTKPAEHLIVVMFPTPDLIEAVFARLKLVDGVGVTAVYSHREYGKKAGDQMSAWLRKNGPTKEKALMGWEGMPQLQPGKK